MGTNKIRPARIPRLPVDPGAVECAFGQVLAQFTNANAGSRRRRARGTPGRRRAPCLHACCAPDSRSEVQAAVCRKRPHEKAITRSNGRKTLHASCKKKRLDTLAALSCVAKVDMQGELSPRAMMPAHGVQPPGFLVVLWRPTPGRRATSRGAANIFVRRAYRCNYQGPKPDKYECCQTYQTKRLLSCPEPYHRQ
jgi:hypothetical protein